MVGVDYNHKSKKLISVLTLPFKPPSQTKIAILASVKTIDFIQKLKVGLKKL